MPLVPQLLQVGVHQFQLKGIKEKQDKMHLAYNDNYCTCDSKFDSLAHVITDRTDFVVLSLQLNRVKKDRNFRFTFDACFHIHWIQSRFIFSQATTTRIIPRLAYVVKRIHSIVESFISSKLIRFECTYKCVIINLQLIAI